MVLRTSAVSACWSVLGSRLTSIAKFSSEKTGQEKSQTKTFRHQTWLGVVSLSSPAMMTMSGFSCATASFKRSSTRPSVVSKLQNHTASGFLSKGFHRNTGPRPSILGVYFQPKKVCFFLVVFWGSKFQIRLEDSVEAMFLEAEVFFGTIIPNKFWKFYEGMVFRWMTGTVGTSNHDVQPPPPPGPVHSSLVVAVLAPLWDTFTTWRPSFFPTMEIT